MKLFGKTWTRSEIEARVGRIEQVAGIRPFRLNDGPETNVRQLQVRTGAGLSYYVSPDRGMDISLAEFMGSPLSWQSQNGDCHPSYFRDQSIEWLRTAAGGLLMTCGLSQVGAPCTDEGENLGAHGKIHHTPAEQVMYCNQWTDDELELYASGVLRESRIFGENLELRRDIFSRAGENSLHIRDTVRNLGFKAVPCMILYHFNFGFPLLSPETQFKFPSNVVVPREEKTPLEGFDQWQNPDPDYAERVYYHSDIQSEMNDDLDRPMASAIIRNPNFPAGTEKVDLSLELSWSVDTLPKLVQWKQPGASTHVMGIEPANCYVAGRASERESGELQYLQPGEETMNDLIISLSVN